jgi:hypothetical protein
LRPFIWFLWFVVVFQVFEEMAADHK